MQAVFPYFSRFFQSPGILLHQLALHHDLMPAAHAFQAKIRSYPQDLPHPCGSQEWEILRVGADFRLKCMGCGHMVMVTRQLVEKNTRGLRKPEQQGRGE